MSNIEAKSQTPSKISHLGRYIYERSNKVDNVFKGNMNAIKYGKIVEAGLVPFITTVYPDGHRLQQDNNPKHRSNHIKRLFKFHYIYWWKTPAKSPELP